MEQVVADETFQDLGELEHAVMQLIWAGRSMTAEAVREELPRRWKETVRTVLRRLEEKRYVTHTVDRRANVFSGDRGAGTCRRQGGPPHRRPVVQRIGGRGAGWHDRCQDVRSAPA
jgi:Penicillinase repressor